ncbi:type II secretion system protein GspL [Castellaniella defragrans]|uniref:General secretion pathway protein L n=1 Tax=Castellaniella defragrans TaxID=75697 RepID=A0A7W9TPT3_CASDE|nr:type II secretion system protein GspL [Castellaniella defragrans]MBB6083562.1 general secretion pathway protein L [Castellaniella defragrans]
MRQHMRLLLPPLSELTPATPLAFALVGRDGRLLRSGALGLRSLAAVAGAGPVHAIVRDEDAVVARITVPPVPARRLGDAVRGSVEPMVLSDLDRLRVAHGPRQPDGAVAVAWTAREPLERAWSLLTSAGLRVESLVPHALALPADDPHPGRVLELPAGPRWLAPLPAWSFVDRELRAAGGAGRWRRPLAWAAAAGAVWILGLNAYAARQGRELEDLRESMRRTVQQAYPRIPVVIDPLRQARQQRDALRLAGGGEAADDFIPLALAAAEVLDFAQGHVLGLRYADGRLTLTLAEGYRPPADEAALARTAAERGIRLARDETRPHVWHAGRPDASEGTRRPAGEAG